MIRGRVTGSGWLGMANSVTASGTRRQVLAADLKLRS